MPDAFSSALSGAGTGATLGSVVPGVGTLIGGGIGLVAGLGKYFLGGKQNKLADQINPNWKPYVESPYAKQSLGLATQLFNGRMPGAAEAARGIQGTQANQISNIGRNATDSSTALALGAASQGQADESVNNLAIKEGGYKAGLLDNVQNAYNQLTGEHHKVYDSENQKYLTDTQNQFALRTAGINNQYGAASDVSSLLALLDQSGTFKNGIGVKKTAGIGNMGKTGGLGVTGYNANQLY